MILSLSLPQEGVNFINEDDARLGLSREREQRRNKFIRVTEPLAGDHRRSNVDERRA